MANTLGEDDPVSALPGRMDRVQKRAQALRTILSGSSWPKYWIECLAVGAAAYAYFRTLSRWRVTDDDEGFYLISGQQLLKGDLPYVDFFFPQTPGSTLVFGIGQLTAGIGIEAGRAAASAMAAVMVISVYAALLRRGRLVAVAACLLCASHPLVASWVVVAKTITLQVAFGTAAVVVAVEAQQRFSRLFIAGALLGCAIACRATTALLALPVILAVMLPPNSAGQCAPMRRRLLPAILGCIVPLLPVLLLAFMAPSRFWFDNVTFHSIYPGGERSWEQASNVFLPSLGLERCSPQDGCAATHNVLLMLLLVLACWRMRRVARQSAPYLVAALVCVAMAFIPVKTYDQYAVAALPFLILFCGTALAGEFRALLAAAALVAVPAASVHLSAYASSDLTQRPKAEDDVARALDTAVGLDGTVSARWPNYLVACTATRLPAARNQFTRLARVSKEVRVQNRLFTDEELYDATLKQPKPIAFVATGRYQDPNFARRLKSAGWKAVGRVGTVEILSP